jgi:hypothetical protein
MAKKPPKSRYCLWHRHWVFVRHEGAHWDLYRCTKCGATELRMRKKK